MKKYYALEKENSTANIMIYGDITSWPWMERDVSAYLLSKQIEEIEADTINVYINSYGGEVAEGLAIHSALKRHKAKVVTYCDGFACSIASAIYMAGDERVMGAATLLMIHNAWTSASGNAEELRKAAGDLDIISEAVANVYRGVVDISNEALEELLANETWIAAEDAVRMGFATKIADYQQSNVPAANARAAVMAKMRAMPAAATVDADAIAQKVIVALGKPDETQPKQKTETKTFLNALMRREVKK